VAAPCDETTRVNGPILSAVEIGRLRTMEKVVTFDWQEELLKRVTTHGQHRVKIADLTTGTTRGEFHVYARAGPDPDDYSTGLVYYDLNQTPTNILRANGPHPNRHKMYHPRRFYLPVRPHVHYLTERYQQLNQARPYISPDGYAVLTTAYRSLRGAMDALARRAHIVSAQLQLPLPPVRELP
jgi:hypothetical protein